jgi:hypothetical protein
MILAIFILTFSFILLSITIHAMFFKHEEPLDPEITKQELIDFIKKLNL